MREFTTTYGLFHSTGNVSISPFVEPRTPGLLVNPKSTVVIDGGITFLQDLATTVFSVKNFEMKNGAILVIGPNSLVISAQKFRCEDAKIVSYQYPAENGVNGKSKGSDGSNGVTGQPGGRVKLETKHVDLGGSGSPLVIDVTGQTGGNGGNGSKGKKGRKGRAGLPGGERRINDTNGAATVSTSTLSATNGSTGASGKPGGNGGTGGSGGVGGTVIVRVRKKDRDKFNIAQRPSKGGHGGTGGLGGKGGKGGKPGRISKNNRYTSVVKKGKRGSAGATGAIGAAGASGPEPKVKLITHR